MVSPRLFPPLSVSGILREIDDLTEAQVDSIAAELREPQLALSDDSRAQFLSKKIGVDAETVEYLFSFLTFVTGELEKKASDDEGRAALIDTLLGDFEIARDESEGSDERTIDTIARLKARLLKLTSRTERSAFLKKALRLRKGFLRNARSFSSFVDLRPVINDSRTEIDGYVAVVQLQIATDRDDEEPTILVQLDEEALSKIMEAVLDIRNKVTLLKSHFPVDRISNK